MRFGYLLLALFFLSQSPSYSQNHNAIEVDLERVKKDIIDLQKFVYQNNNLELSDQIISSSKIKNSLKDIAEIDAAIKGLSGKRPWQSIRDLALNF